MRYLTMTLTGLPPALCCNSGASLFFLVVADTKHARTTTVIRILLIRLKLETASN